MKYVLIYKYTVKMRSVKDLRQSDMYCTVAAFSKHAMNNLPIDTLKTLALLCNKNSIIFCIDKGAKYHRVLYLQDKEETICQ